MPVSITWLGNAGYEIITDSGLVLLTDPQVRGMEGAPRAIEAYTRADAVFVTHGDPGHHLNSAQVAEQTGALYITNPVLAAYQRKKGRPNPAKVISLPVGEAWRIGDVTIVPFEVAHPPFSPAMLARMATVTDAPGQPNYGWVFDFGRATFLHMGDALPDPVLEKLAKTYGATLLALSIVSHGEELTQTVDWALAILRAVQPTYVAPVTRWRPDDPAVAQVRETIRREGLGSQFVFTTPGETFELPT